MEVSAWEQAWTLGAQHGVGDQTGNRIFHPSCLGAQRWGGRESRIQRGAGVLGTCSIAPHPSGPSSPFRKRRNCPGLGSAGAGAAPGASQQGLCQPWGFGAQSCPPFVCQTPTRPRFWAAGVREPTRGPERRALPLWLELSSPAWRMLIIVRAEPRTPGSLWGQLEEGGEEGTRVGDRKEPHAGA